MPRRSASVELAVEQAAQLERWIRVGATPQQVVLRAKIVRQAAAGSSDKLIAAELKVHPRTVALWRQRVRDEGIEGIWQVAAGRGRKPTYGATTVSGWIERTLQMKPAGATHWSTRSLGEEVGVSKNTIHRAWQDHQLKPHLTKSFKLSGIRSLWRSSPTWSASICSRRRTLWSCVWMRRAKFRRSTVRSLACP